MTDQGGLTMQPRNLILFFFTTALLFGASSSMAVAPWYPSDQCQTDDDCEGGRCDLVWIDGYEDECSDDDWNCYEVLACVSDIKEGPLQPPIPQECFHDDECPEGTYCEEPYFSESWCEDEDEACSPGYVPRYCVVLEQDPPENVCYGPSDCPPAHDCTIDYADPTPGSFGGGICVPSEKLIPPGACLEDSECQLGFVCEGTSLAVPEPSFTEYEVGPEDYGRCTPDVCSGDGDCSGNLVCHLSTTPCGEPLDDGPAVPCNPETAMGICGPQWLSDDCVQDADCGSGFACVHHSVCAGKNGLWTTEMDEADASGGGIVECQSLSRCEPLLVACEEGVCDEDFVCTDLSSTALSTSDVDVNVEDRSAGLMDTLCLPEDYEAWTESGVGTVGDLRFEDVAPIGLHVPGVTTNLSAGRAVLGGCQGGSAPSQGWLLALLALGMVARRRSCGVLKDPAIG
jgi:MYXO-CTERM domain-containing protein